MPETRNNEIWRAVLDSCTSYPPHATTWSRGGYRNDVPTLCERCTELIAKLQTIEAVPHVEEWEYALRWITGEVTDVNHNLKMMLAVISQYPGEVRLVRRYVGAWEDAPEEKV